MEGGPTWRAWLTSNIFSTTQWWHLLINIWGTHHVWKWLTTQVSTVCMQCFLFTFSSHSSEVQHALYHAYFHFSFVFMVSWNIRNHQHSHQVDELASRVSSQDRLIFLNTDLYTIILPNRSTGFIAGDCGQLTIRGTVWIIKVFGPKIMVQVHCGSVHLHHGNQATHIFVAR